MTRSPIAVRDEERTPDGENDRIWCHWAECELPSSGLFYLIECGASPGLRLGTAAPPPGYASLGPHGELPRRRMCTQCRVITFCSAGHQDFYQRSHRPGQYGRHSAGVNGRYL